MIFLEFRKAFDFWPVIPVPEIEKLFPGFDRNALTRWQRKGYLEKIRNGFYRLTEKEVKSDADRFFIANRIYAPAYVSLQSALRWYDFIPEGVFTVTSVTTNKPHLFQTPIGSFSYRSIRNDLFFGYRLETFGDYRFKIAKPAKAFLDMLYLFPHLDSEDHFFEMRLNFEEIREKFSLREFNDFLSLYSSKALEERALVLVNFLKSYDVIR